MPAAALAAALRAAPAGRARGGARRLALVLHPRPGERVGLVQQEPVLFGLSISDNVKYGLDRPVSDEEVDRLLARRLSSSRCSRRALDGLEGRSAVWASLRAFAARP